MKKLNRTILTEWPVSSARLELNIYLELYHSWGIFVLYDGNKGRIE
jgi:hypothetical protein